MITWYLQFRLTLERVRFDCPYTALSQLCRVASIDHSHHSIAILGYSRDSQKMQSCFPGTDTHQYQDWLAGLSLVNRVQPPICLYGLF